jgi:hypothetical protein
MRIGIQRGLLYRKELEEDHEFIPMIDASGSSSYATRVKGKTARGIYIILKKTVDLPAIKRRIEGVL